MSYLVSKREYLRRFVIYIDFNVHELWYLEPERVGAGFVVLVETVQVTSGGAGVGILTREENLPSVGRPGLAVRFAVECNLAPYWSPR
jgi:hypothetical protein